jgi:hypothetical protein
MTVDISDYEQLLIECSCIINDIDLLLEGIHEHDFTLDNVANALLGMSTLGSLRFTKVHDMTEELFEERRALIQAKVDALALQQPSRAEKGASHGDSDDNPDNTSDED